MASLFPNLYHLRKVATTSSSPCTICYKPSDSVLVTPDNKDFFYVCVKHLGDRSFATAIGGEVAEPTKGDDVAGGAKSDSKDGKNEKSDLKGASEESKEKEAKGSKLDDATKPSTVATGSAASTDGSASTTAIAPSRIYNLHK